LDEEGQVWGRGRPRVLYKDLHQQVMNDLGRKYRRSRGQVARITMAEASSGHVFVDPCLGRVSLPDRPNCRGLTSYIRKSCRSVSITSRGYTNSQTNKFKINDTASFCSTAYINFRADRHHFSGSLRKSAIGKLIGKDWRTVQQRIQGRIYMEQL
jgi:hypothetical protein